MLCLTYENNITRFYTFPVGISQHVFNTIKHLRAKLNANISIVLEIIKNNSVSAMLRFR